MSGPETGALMNTGIGIPNMHLAYSGDGPSPVYKPVPVISAPVYLQAADGSADTGMTTPMTLKRKRGRPRKYGPGAIPMPTSLSPPNANATPVVGGGGGFSGSGGSLQFSPSQAPASAPPHSSSSSMKKTRGRLPGSSKKHHQQNNLGSTGIGFTPHVITVKAGEELSISTPLR